MKNCRRFAMLAAVLLLVICFTIPAFAEGTSAKLSYVTDNAGLFTDTQREALEAKAAQISERYDLGVYIITLDDFRKYTTSGHIEDCVIETYDKYSLGWGDDHAGTTLMLSMAERDYALDFHSPRADYAFTEAGRDRMEDRVLRYFRNNDFYGGYDAYLDTCAEYLLAAENGAPVGQGEPSSADSDSDGIGGFAAIPGAIAAALTGVFMSSPMHSAGKKHDANSYVVEGSLELHRRSDMFLHRTVTRTPRQTQSSSGSSGSHHYSSGGHSGRSGKF